MNRLLFNLWYLTKPPWDTGITPPELVAFIERHPAGRALDLGCGTGTNVIALARHGWQAVGIDFAWPAIRAARIKARRAGVKVNFLVGDVARPPAGNHFDLVLDIGCYHSLPQERRRIYVKNLEGLLSPGGTWLLYSFLKDEDGGEPGIHEREIGGFSIRFKLASRQDSRDPNGRRSVWLEYRR
jgi:SAM-dependent methyltransferase